MFLPIILLCYKHIVTNKLCQQELAITLGNYQASDQTSYVKIIYMKERK
jgi:hypothetical protein